MDQLESQSQEVRDRVGELIFAITLKQLFNFHYMQTDPNPANFFYNVEKDILYLIDFGAGICKKRKQFFNLSHFLSSRI